MAIGALIIEWFISLEKRGILDGKTLLEIGPQDIQQRAQKTLNGFIKQKELNHGGDLVNRIINQNTDTMNGTRLLYSLFGIKEYFSADFFDERADYKVDINEEFDLKRKFDIVTNFGTAEHCFNIANVFKMMDLHLEEDGFMLLCLPVFGGINHGFYNIHPSLYFDIARENKYHIEDFHYIDNAPRRSKNTMIGSFNADRNAIYKTRKAKTIIEAQNPFAIQLLMVNNHFKNIFKQILMVIPLIIKNFVKLFLNKLIKNKYPYTKIKPLYKKKIIVRDYCFVAMRKMNRMTNFRFPMQGRYEKK